MTYKPKKNNIEKLKTFLKKINIKNKIKNGKFLQQ